MVFVEEIYFFWNTKQGKKFCGTLTLAEVNNELRKEGRRLVSDHRQYKATLSYLNNVLAYQNYLFHHDKTLLMNNDNLPVRCLILPLQDYSECIQAFV